MQCCDSAEVTVLCSFGEAQATNYYLHLNLPYASSAALKHRDTTFYVLFPRIKSQDLMELKLEQSLPEHTYRLKSRTFFSRVHKCTLTPPAMGDAITHTPCWCM